MVICYYQKSNLFLGRAVAFLMFIFPASLNDTYIFHSYHLQNTGSSQNVKQKYQTRPNTCLIPQKMPRYYTIPAKPVSIRHYKAADGNRTRDLRTTNATLYRLSHSSMLTEDLLFRHRFVVYHRVSGFVNCFFNLFFRRCRALSVDFSSLPSTFAIC